MNNNTKVTNFVQWCCTYDEILFPWYEKFILLFEEKKCEPPSYNMFLTYIYKSTKKIIIEGKVYAPIITNK